MNDPFEPLARAYGVVIRAAARGATNGVAWGDEGDLVWAMAPVEVAFVNRVMLPRLAPGDADERIASIVARYDRAGTASSWWLDPLARPTDLDARLTAYGYAHDGTVHAMDLDLALLPPLDPPVGVTLELVADREALTISQRVAAASFGATPEVGDAFAAYRAPAMLGEGAPGRVVLARLDGRPVATATAVTDDDLVGLYTVTTLPDVRGRGLGRAVSLAVLADAARRGGRLAVLESSDQGHGVYQRIGFRDLGPIRLFARPPAPPAAHSDGAHLRT